MYLLCRYCSCHLRNLESFFRSWAPLITAAAPCLIMFSKVNSPPRSLMRPRQTLCRKYFARLCLNLIENGKMRSGRARKQRSFHHAVCKHLFWAFPVILQRTNLPISTYIYRYLLISTYIYKCLCDLWCSAGWQPRGC